MSLPLGLLPVPRQAFYTVTAGGLVPVSNGSLSFFVAGGSTPAEVFADPDGNTSRGPTVDLDDDGYAPAIYLSPIGYKVVLKNEDDVTIWSQDYVENVAEAFLATWGAKQTEGSKGVGDGYEIVPADNLVTVNEPSVDPAKIYLQIAVDRGTPVTIKNVGPTSVAIYPFASETIDDLPTPYVIPAASSPTFPTITLNSDEIGNYWIMSSHKLG